MPMSATEADRILSEEFRTLAKSAKRTNVYYGLITGDPDAGGVEVTGSGYARVAIPINDANWSAPATEGTYRYVSNVLAVTFGSPTGDWNSGSPIPWFGIWDAASAGNRLYDGALPTARTIIGGDDPAQAPPGAIKIKFGV
jgi:hypothetical protein